MIEAWRPIGLLTLLSNPFIAGRSQEIRSAASLPCLPYVACRKNEGQAIFPLERQQGAYASSPLTAHENSSGNTQHDALCKHSSQLSPP